MKNLILTFAISLISMFSFGQILIQINTIDSKILKVNTTKTGYTYTGYGVPIFNSLSTNNLSELNISTISIGEGISAVNIGPTNNITFIDNNIVTFTQGTITDTIDLTAVMVTLSTDVVEVGGLKVYPNPVVDVLNVSFDSNTDVDVVITNMNGQVMYTEKTNFTTTIDTSSFPQGIYFLTVGNKTSKIIKQ